MRYDCVIEGRQPEASPEQQMFAQVFVLAVKDLSSFNRRERNEAFDFLFSKSRERAQHRGFLLGAIGVDDETLQISLAEIRSQCVAGCLKIDSMLTHMELLDRLPEGVFTIHDVRACVDMRPNSIATRLRHLRELGFIEKPSYTCYRKVTQDLSDSVASASAPD